MLSTYAERTPQEQDLISQFYAAMTTARQSENYFDFEAGNHVHNLLCELSLPAPSFQRTTLIRYVREYDWTQVSEQFRARFQQMSQRLLEEGAN